MTRFIWNFSRGLIALSLLCSAGCTDPGETTAIGAGSGGVLGAGLGAIIGSTTGNAGAGLVIGGVAGSAAGAAVGNAFQAQEEALVQQDEAIERQEARLLSQKRELQQLRMLEHDDRRATSSYSRGRSTQRSEGQSYSEQRARPDLSGLSAEEILRQRRLQAATAREQELRMRTTKATPTVVRNSTSQNASVRNSDIQSSRAKSGTGTAPVIRDAPVKERDLIVATAPIEAPEGVYNWDKGVREPATGEGPPSAGIPAAMQPIEKRTDTESTPSCREAEQEARQASNASEASDRLFHLRRALRLCPSGAQYHAKLGALYGELGRSEDARFEFQKALELEPDNSDALAGLDNLQENDPRAQAEQTDAVRRY
jgi:osmotically inducible lipoprotein OsmB